MNVHHAWEHCAFERGDSRLVLTKFEEVIIKKLLAHIEFTLRFQPPRKCGLSSVTTQFQKIEKHKQETKHHCDLNSFLHS